MSTANVLSELLGQRREVKLVAFLEQTLESGGKFHDLLEHERIDNLPTMLMRHGLLQTWLFLECKEKEDRHLLQLLECCILESTGEHLPTSAALAGDPVRALFFQAQAIEAATWIRRVAKAKLALRDAADASRTARSEKAS